MRMYSLLLGFEIGWHADEAEFCGWPQILFLTSDNAGDTDFRCLFAFLCVHPRCLCGLRSTSICFIPNNIMTKNTLAEVEYFIIFPYQLTQIHL